MLVPVPTPIYRITHIDNLPILLCRGGLHAPNNPPNDGLPYKTIHNESIQCERRIRPIHCGPGGVIHDYVSFYLGPRSPMLYQLHTGRVADYHEGQEPIIYLVSTVKRIRESGVQFVFSDGHGIARMTDWFDDLNDMSKVDWDTVNAKYWKDKIDDMDRQRRKQAEFLVYRFFDWNLICEIGVINNMRKKEVELIMSGFDDIFQRNVYIRPEWYY